MDNTLKPIEAFVQQGLAQRFQQVFNSPLVYSNSPDRRAEAAKLLQRGLKYPLAFASITRDAITEGTYRPHALWRRGLVSGLSNDEVTASKLNLIPITSEYEITYIAQSLADIRKFSKLWLLGSIQSALKFSVTFGVVDLDINVVQETQVNIPQRETGLSEAKEYVASVNVTVSGYMSNDVITKSQVVTSVEGFIRSASDVHNISLDTPEPMVFGVTSSTYVMAEVEPDTSVYIDISVPANTFNIVLYEDRFIGFRGGNAALDGKRFVLRVSQGAPGGFIINWDVPNSVTFGGDIPAVELTPEVGRFDYIGFMYRHAANTCDVIAFSRDYSEG